MEYTRLDLIYAVNLLSIHSSDPSATSFQVINRLIRYLSVWPHHPIMYPAGLDFTATHDLCQEVSPDNFHSQKISNGLIYFSYLGEDHSPKYKRSVACAIHCIFGVAIHWSDKTQPASAAHSTDSYVRTFYLSTKIVQWIWTILQNLGNQISDAPTPTYEDI